MKNIWYVGMMYLWNGQKKFKNIECDYGNCHLEKYGIGCEFKAKI